MNYDELKIEMKKYPSTMTNEERAVAYANGDVVDHIPFYICDTTMAPLYGYTMEEYRQSFEIQCNLMEQMIRDYDHSPSVNLGLGLRGMGEALGSRLVYPENGIDYVVEHVLDNYNMLETLEERFDCVSNSFLVEKIKTGHRFREKYGKEFPIMVDIVGPLSAASAIRKTELLMKDLVKNVDKIHELLAMTVRLNLKWIETMVKEFGNINVYLSDPVSSTTLISERNFVEFCKPHLADLMKGIKEILGEEIGLELHICGKSKALWKHIVELGFVSFSVDNCEDLKELKEAVGDKISISGNVPPVEVLRNGTIDDVIESVQQCLLKGSDSPMGYVLGAGCQVPIGTPVENIEAFIYAARRYGRGAQIGKLCCGLYEEGLIC